MKKQLSRKLGICLKSKIKKLAPSLFYAIKRRKHLRKFKQAHGGAEYRAKRALVDAHGLKVLSGPFNGMRYGDDVHGSAYVAKLVGSYEAELHPTIERIIRQPYTTVVDIGCAEGYYAVGLAQCMPEAHIYAYDTDENSRYYTKQLAQLNSVESRVTVLGLCRASDLQTLCGPETVLLVDCEGAEFELLDPEAAFKLTETDIVVELHEHLRPGVTETVLSRFHTTHDIDLVDTQDRDVSEYSVLELMNESDRPWAVREGRGVAMQWAVMTAKAGVRRS